MIAQSLFTKEALLRAKGCCPFCAEKVNLGEFTNPIDYAEFKISGLCKNCQDQFFDSGEDHED
jgi:hypothetical protein